MSDATSREPRSLFATPPVADQRFLSRDACRALADRVFAMGTGGGQTRMYINSQWTGNIRWARNVVTSGGDTQETVVDVARTVRGANSSGVSVNALNDDAMREAIRRAEESVKSSPEDPDDFPSVPFDYHAHLEPKIWFDSSYNLDAEARGATTASLIAPGVAAGVSSAGYLQVTAFGEAYLNSDNIFRYFPYTSAQYSVTVRDTKAGASGWAGVDFADYARIDTARLSRIALDKCLRSRNPVAVEPGRYTAVLEPQAVCDLFAPILDQAMSRQQAERGGGPFAAGNGNSKIGQQVLDPRLTISADVMDPDLGFLPFSPQSEPYVDVTWIKNGVLKELEYDRYYAVRQLGKEWALPNSKAFRMSGGTTTIEQMIANTRRGVLVTRFNGIRVIDDRSMMMNGNTRDGLWLIENGKISKAIKNFRFTDSPLFALNNVDALGVPQRVFRPDAPAVCPPVLVRDFSFTALSDAI